MATASCHIKNFLVYSNSESGNLSAMKYLILLLMLFFSINLFAQDKKAETVEVEDTHLYNNCRKSENKPCISMELNVLDKKIIVSKNQVGAETEFTLKLFGKLSREVEKEHVVKFLASGEEKGCTTFGKSPVAVLGFSNSGNPIVLTDKGALELTSKLVTVGAKNIEIVNLNNLKRESVLSKSLDMTPAAISKIHFDSSGSVYFIDGIECFNLRKNELLRKVDIKRCESKKSELKETSKIEKIRLKPNQNVYELKDSSTIMILDMTTCS